MRKLAVLSVTFLLGFVVGSASSLAKTKAEFHEDVAHALLET